MALLCSYCGKKPPDTSVSLNICYCSAMCMIANWISQDPSEPVNLDMLRKCFTPESLRYFKDGHKYMKDQDND